MVELLPLSREFHLVWDVYARAWVYATSRPVLTFWGLDTSTRGKPEFSPGGTFSRAAVEETALGMCQGVGVMCSVWPGLYRGNAVNVPIKHNASAGRREHIVQSFLSIPPPAHAPASEPTLQHVDVSTSTPFRLTSTTGSASHMYPTTALIPIPRA